MPLVPPPERAPSSSDRLSQEIGATSEQAAGAAGALFGVAKSRLAPDQFSQVANAVPGMDLLLKAAPAASAVAGTSGALAALGLDRWPGSRSRGVFEAWPPTRARGQSRPDSDFVRDEVGGADVGNLLASVLK